MFKHTGQTLCTRGLLGAIGGFPPIMLSWDGHCG